MPAASHQQHQGAPSTPHSVAQALVIKDEDLFFLCEQDGNVPIGKRHGLGLYYHDCRFLDGYELRLGGQKLESLATSSGQGFEAFLELSNPVIPQNGSTIRRQAIGLRWERVLDVQRLRLLDRFIVHNYTLQRVQLPLDLKFRAAFEDIFVVRGSHPPEHARPSTSAWKRGRLEFRYEGEDRLYRTTAIHFSISPQRQDDQGALFQLDLAPQQEQVLDVDIGILEAKDAEKAPSSRSAPRLESVQNSGRRNTEEWIQQEAAVTSEHPPLDRVLGQSLRDLRMLRSRFDELAFLAAGVPWYVTLFGRDSMIASLETLAFEPRIAEQSLRLLARLQGRKNDPRRAEEPGKIMHEWRVGELANAGEIPFTPYYGSVDSTPLFLILVGLHAQWTGSLALFKELTSAVDAALHWIFEMGALRQSGYLVYGQIPGQALTNQGWKDSNDAIVNADGSLAQPPIALAEVQGYAYLALNLMADLFERSGDGTQPAHLRREAARLQERFNRDFWMEDLGVYAMALQKDGRPTQVVASNTGQVLWSGIAPQDRAQRVIHRLMQDDMFNGWGIRTLSSKEKRYNPIEYHLGTVWPHDNALISAGFRRYGDIDAVEKIFMGILDAGSHFAHNRLPEVFAGFRKDSFEVPVHYPTACHPQAWASGAIPYFLQTLLGLQPEAFEHRLRVSRPHLPAAIAWLDIKRVKVGEAHVDLRFKQTETGKLSVTVLNLQGRLNVVVD